MWAAKLRAFAIHFLLTITVASVFLYIVLKLWYPGGLAFLMGGLEIFLLLMICDVVLGPLLSLVIYNPAKTKKDLVSDYSIIVAIQLFALAYGISVLADARPAYLVYTVDRYVFVSAGEIPHSERVMAKEPAWRNVSWMGGYHTVFVEKVDDPEESFNLITSALSGGRDLQHVVSNYRSIEDHRPEILSYSKPINLVRERYQTVSAKLEEKISGTGMAEKDLRWLPVQAGTEFWIAIISANTAEPVAWLDVDPFF